MGRKIYGPVLVGGMGAYLILRGAVAVVQGDLEWRNYWGGFVYAPFAIMIGLLLVLLLFKRDRAERGRRTRRFKDRSGFSWTKGKH